MHCTLSVLSGQASVFQFEGKCTESFNHRTLDDDELMLNVLRCHLTY